ncbi:MAG: AI-2E family transporter [Opitutaceae bacterium]|nr:AI-2E family transporter [Cytophagales bacterium]
MPATPLDLLPNKGFKIPAYMKISHIFIAIIGGYIILDYGSDILMTFFIAMFLSFMLIPISNYLQKKRFPKWIAIVISILLAIFIISIILCFFAYQLLSLHADLPELKTQFHLKYIELQHHIENRYDYSQQDQTLWVDHKINEFTANTSNYIMKALSTTGTLIANLALIPIYIFLITYYKEKILTFMYSLVEPRLKRKLNFTIAKVCIVSQQYLKGILLDILILSILNSIGFLALGLKHALLFAALAAFLNIVPYIGVLVGSVFPIAIALLTKDSLWYAAGAAGVCVVVQFLDNNFITPKVVGSSVSINPLAATIALLMGAKVWGIIGMILSIPVTGMFKVMFDQMETLKSYGFLLGQENRLIRRKNGIKEVIEVPTNTRI